MFIDRGIFRSPGEDGGGNDQPAPSPEAAPDGGQDFGLKADDNDYPDVGDRQNFKGYGEGEPDSDDGVPSGVPARASDETDAEDEETDQDGEGEEKVEEKPDDEKPTSEVTDEAVQELTRKLEEAGQKHESLSGDIRNYVNSLQKLGLVDEKGNVSSDVISKLQKESDKKDKSDGSEKEDSPEVTADSLRSAMPDATDDTLEILAKYTNVMLAQQKSALKSDIQNQIQEGLKAGKAETELESRRKVSNAQWTSFVNGESMAELRKTPEGKEVIAAAEKHAQDKHLWETNPERIAKDAINYVTAKMAGKIVTDGLHKANTKAEKKAEKLVGRKPIPAGGGDKPVSSSEMNKRRSKIVSSNVSSTPIQQMVKDAQNRPMFG